ncbi:MAG: c-type cytochrome [Pseudomonadota bacterium]
MRTTLRPISLVAAQLLLSLAACQAPPSPPTAQDVSRAETLRPADAALAAIYERSCLSCHSTVSAAPLTGFAAAWAPRLEQGMDVLVSHARDGFKGMPAKGLCNDCSDDDLRHLIQFMTQSHAI